MPSRPEVSNLSTWNTRTPSLFFFLGQWLQMFSNPEWPGQPPAANGARVWWVGELSYEWKGRDAFDHFNRTVGLGWASGNGWMGGWLWARNMVIVQSHGEPSNGWSKMEGDLLFFSQSYMSVLSGNVKPFLQIFFFSRISFVRDIFVATGRRERDKGWRKEMRPCQLEDVNVTVLMWSLISDAVGWHREPKGG